MDNVETDRIRRVYRQYYAGRYRDRWSSENPGNQRMLLERRALLQRYLASLSPLSNRKILDVGCGTGKELLYLTELGVPEENLYGVDLMEERFAAVKKGHPNVNFSTANAENLPYHDGSFDLVLLFTVFSSILDEGSAKNVARQVIRVLKMGGAVLLYDNRFPNPVNPHTRAVPLSLVREYFPGCPIQRENLTLLPPLARRLGKTTAALYPLLAKIPFLKTHHLLLIWKAK